MNENPNLPCMVWQFLHAVLCIFCSAIDCFELGRLAYNQGDYYHTILWMEQAYEIMTAGDIPDPDDPDSGLVLDYLAYSYYVVWLSIHFDQNLENLKRWINAW